jgi:hypothetical protein
MIRIFFVAASLIAALVYAACERYDMYDLAKYGLPPRGALYIFQAGIHDGNLGGRDGADSICYNQGYVYYTLLKAGTVKAFISISVIDEIRNLVPADFWAYPVFGIDPSLAVTPIADSWASLWSGNIKNPLQLAIGLPVLWWSGSNSDGSVIINLTCNGWQAADTTQGQVGDPTFTSAEWISSPTPQACNTTQYLLCLAY